MVFDPVTSGKIANAWYNHINSPTHPISPTPLVTSDDHSEAEFSQLNTTRSEVPWLSREKSVGTSEGVEQSRPRHNGPPPLHRRKRVRRSLSPDSMDKMNLPPPCRRRFSPPIPDPRRSDQVTIEPNKFDSVVPGRDQLSSISNDHNQSHDIAPDLTKSSSPTNQTSQNTNLQTPPNTILDEPDSELPLNYSTSTQYTNKVPSPRGQPMRRKAHLSDDERLRFINWPTGTSTNSPPQSYANITSPGVDYQQKHSKPLPNNNVRGEQAHLELSDYTETQRRDHNVKKMQDDPASTLSIPTNVKISQHREPFAVKRTARSISIPLPNRKMFCSRFPKNQDPNKLFETVGRILNSRPFATIDVRGFNNDYFTNNLVWSSLNLIALSLIDPESSRSALYIMNNETQKFIELKQETQFIKHIYGLSWSRDSKHLAVGLSNGTCEIWEVNKNKLLGTLECNGKTGPLSCMSWSPNLFATGNHLGQMAIHDLQLADHKIQALEPHDGKVCNLTWRDDGLKLASSGEDGFVKVFDGHSYNPIFSKKLHDSSVKALAWCPWNPDLLATGGGEDDHKIIIINISTREIQFTYDTGSIVSSLLWSPHTKELAATHGAPTNYFSLWSPELEPISQYSVHWKCILQSALSPDGYTYCTVSSDTDLNFWTPFGSEEYPE